MWQTSILGSIVCIFCVMNVEQFGPTTNNYFLSHCCKFATIFALFTYFCELCMCRFCNLPIAYHQCKFPVFRFGLSNPITQCFHILYMQIEKFRKHNMQNSQEIENTKEITKYKNKHAFTFQHCMLHFPCIHWICVCFRGINL